MLSATIFSTNNILNYNFGSVAYSPALASPMYFGLATEVIIDTVSIPTRLDYSSLLVTLYFSNSYSNGNWVTVSGVNSAFSVTNVDGTWEVVAHTETYIRFYVSIQPTGTTPNYAGGGFACKNPVSPSGGSYARVSYSNNKTTWAVSTLGKIVNAVSIAFPTATGNWGDITSIFISDSATYGNIFWYANLPVKIFVGTSGSPPYTDLIFTAGSIAITIT